MTKNRTLIAIFCIVLAAALCFGVAPLINAFFNDTTTAVMLNTDVAPGVQIESSMLSNVTISKNSQVEYITDRSEIVGKFAKSYLYKGVITPAMLSETNETPESKLLSLKEGEYAMSVSVQSLASGFGAKLETGDVIMIVTKDDDGNAVLYDELAAVEVIATTNSSGTDLENTAGGSDDDLPSTITVKLVDKEQVSCLFECETETSLHAVLVTKDREIAEKVLSEQAKIFSEKRGAEIGNGIFVPAKEE